MMSKTMAVVLAILEEVGAPIHRTKLVKLVYLADNLFYEHFGKTITGLRYMWDNHGPNAISNAIVREADKLVQKDLACMKVGRSIYGSENYLYRIGPKKTNIAEGLLNPLERQMLRDTVKRYRRYSISEIIAESKRTKPFEKVAQYDVLEMGQSSEYANLVKAMEADAGFMAGVKEGIKAGAEVGAVRLQEVRQKYGL